MAETGARDRHEAIHHELRRRICLLDYPPGMKLSETELAEDFGVSRTPLRRALARLEDEGLLQSQHGVGTFVTAASLAELEQVYQLRLELVELTGRLDPIPADAAYRARFDALLQRSADIVDSGTARVFTEFDIEVFQTLLELIGNQPLRQVQERLYYQTKRIWLTLAMQAKLDLQEEFRIFHHELEAISLALDAQDPAALAQLQRAHISMSFKRLQQASPG
ncbi:MAG: GntR family transcriptional regulator [Pseudomonadota bacterium]|jgi:DNA-binding GntR family transcriptional regulator|nr:GntR family transcriptional regulator [Pseudomonadota bacterium]MEC8293935.1 GntR family transcriptional regulator [Pseudomonadota bacterium]